MAGQVSMTTSRPAARARCGGGLVDHAELEPDGLDAQPVLLGDRVVDDRADPRAVHEAVDDVDRARDVGEAAVALLAEGVLAPEIDRNDGHAESVAQVTGRSGRRCARCWRTDRRRPRLPGLSSAALITSGSRQACQTAVPVAAGQPPPSSSRAMTTRWIWLVPS